ncbi:MAP kinase-activated protein kinase 2 (Fragment) [Seminavis robusta]|uniref:non-specific serine/threonine protein kinase n=1 Tax=Seminavis robusta TaxID=568900 RepID=A0A9N8HGU0_9STRA
MASTPSLIEEKPRSSSADDLTITRQDFLFHRKSTHATNDTTVGERWDDHYRLSGQWLGKGRFGRVALVEHLQTGQKRAMKLLEKRQVSPEAFWKETQVLKTLDHPNLLRLYETFEDDTRYYIVTERATQHGNLFYFFRELQLSSQNQKSLNELDIARLIRQILVCVNHCHAHGVIHSDIKMENILLDADDPKFERITLADFGFSLFYHQEEERPRRGTPEYLAPEVFVGTTYGPKCDIWSLGVMAFVLLTEGHLPFTGTQQEIYNQISMNTRTDHWDLPAWEQVTPEGKAFVQSLLQVDEAKRPTAQEALSDSWFEIIMIQQQQSTTILEASSWHESLLKFSARQKLQQATYAFLVAQLTFKSRKKVIDEMFKGLDVNDDGTISRQEIEDACTKRGCPISKEELHSIFRNVDIDQNDCINYWEFTAATANPRNMLCEDNLEIAFQTFDVNKDNCINAEDLKVIFRHGGLIGGYHHEEEEDSVVDEAVIDAIVEEVDANGDGKISLEEFKAMMEETVKLQTTKRPRCELGN